MKLNSNGAFPPVTFDNCGILALICPVCGGTGLHQQSVSVYQRDAEDAATGIAGHTADGEVRADRDMDLNPSARRDGMLIDFECESCEGYSPQLAILQHKGQTLVKWERVWNVRS